jgi:hypothetical protein
MARNQGERFTPSTERAAKMIVPRSSTQKPVVPRTAGGGEHVARHIDKRHAHEEPCKQISLKDHSTQSSPTR